MLFFWVSDIYSNHLIAAHLFLPDLSISALLQSFGCLLHLELFCPGFISVDFPKSISNFISAQINPFTLAITTKTISSQNDFLLSDITEGKVNQHSVILTEATANANKAKYDKETAGDRLKAPGNLCCSINSAWNGAIGRKWFSRPWGWSIDETTGNDKGHR